MKSIDDYTEEFIGKIKGTQEYRRFSKKRTTLHEHPELMEKVNEYRRQLMQIQQSEGAYDKVDIFYDQNKEFLANPLARDYLEADLALCRLLQSVMEQIAGSVDLDLEERE